MNTKSFKLLGRNIVSTFDHSIMRLSFDDVFECDDNLKMECVTNDSEKFIEGTFSVNTLKRVLLRNQGKCEVFVFYDNNGKEIGTLSVMFKGGDELEYKIRNIDAFIFNVRVIPECRGRGYVLEMIKQTVRFLRSRSIDEVYLAVSRNNHSALRAYQKVGFKEVKHTSFIRILRMNFPYIIL